MNQVAKITINQDLPIAAFEEEIIEKFETSSNLIVIGETGSGKTTQLPLMLLKSASKYQDLTHGKIAVTQPRRIAATSVAAYEATLVGEELGESIGFKIRFEEKVSDTSKIIFMTDGIMLREAQLDPLLLDYSVVMVDEAHERNINSDFLIGLLVDIQKKRKLKGVIPLKILVTSATLEKEKFERFFNMIEGESLASVEVPGRLFPITTIYEKREVFAYEQTAAEKVRTIVHEGKRGDILIFMPGKREIEKTKEAIQALDNFDGMNLEIITIHANLPIEEQNKIFVETDKRKVVIATNIAETSLTVPGIVFVIDSGLIKQMEFNPHSGINSLITQPHARKGLEQRKGRAGRIEPGVYYALYTEQSYASRPEFQRPEILRTSLSQMVLIMKRVGINDIEHFHFVDSPEPNLLHNALTELTRLGALDRDGTITAKGLTMASLPLEPRLANLIIEAQKNHCVESIVTISSFLELKPIILNLTEDDFLKKYDEDITLQAGEKYDKAYGNFRSYLSTIRGLEYEGSDFMTILKIWKLWLKNEMRHEWAEMMYLSSETLDEGANIREELLDIVRKSGYEPEDKHGPDLEMRIEKTLVSAFKFNILVRQPNGTYRNARLNQSGIRLHNSSVLIKDKPYYALAFEVIEISEIDALPKLSARILHGLTDQAIRSQFPEIYKRQRSDRFRSPRRNPRFQSNRSRGRRRR